MSNQETKQEQIQFSAQQELKHLRTRCGKVYALGNNRFRAVVQTTPVHEYDAATHQWVKAPTDGGAGAQPDCDVRGQRK